MDMGDEEDFSAKNLPRNPTEKLLYNRTGKSYEDEHVDIPKRPGRLEAGCVMSPEKSLPKPGKTHSPINAGPAKTAILKYLPKPGTT